MKLLRNYPKTIIGLIVGGIAGYLYWRFVGCTSGTCMITSRPLNMTLYGMMMGGLLFNLFEKKKNTDNHEHKRMD